MIIQATGKECRFSTVSGDELILALQAKLFEEIQEFVDSDRDLEELADIVEVVDGLATQLGSSLEDIMERKRKKKDKRGGFEQGIWLEWVKD